MFTFNFSLAYTAFWLAFGVPGMLVSLGLLSKDKRLSLIEILIAGIGIGVITTSLIGVLPLILNINFTTTVAYGVILLSYIIGIFVVYKEFDSVKERLMGIVNWAKSSIESINKALNGEFSGLTLKVQDVIIGLILLYLVYTSFHIRMQSFSPIFQELDPYFYLYSTYQLVSQGVVPYTDATAWYPHPSSHRTMPLLTAFEGIWYLLTVSGVDIYYLSGIANIYPPIAGAMAVFFIYLLFSMRYKNKWLGLAIGFMLTYLPTFLLKTVAGEFEIQPFAFFGISFSLFSIYYLISSKNTKESLALTFISFAGLSLASASSIVLIATLVIAGTALFLVSLLKGEKINEDIVKSFTYICVVFLIVALFNVAYKLSISQIFRYLPLIIPPLLMIAYNWLHDNYEKLIPTLKTKMAFREASIIAGILLAILLLISPLGTDLIKTAKLSASVGQYNTPLEWTIAEQNPAGKALGGYLGAIGGNAYSFLKPMAEISGIIVNAIMEAISHLINIVLQTNIKYIPKLAGTYMIVILAFFIGSVWYTIELFRRKTIDHKEIFFLIVAGLFIPIFTVGVIKAKYVIYFGYAFVVMIGFVFGEFMSVISKLVEKVKTLSKYNAWVRVFSFILFYLLFIHPNVFNDFTYYITQTANIPKVSLQPSAFQTDLAALCNMGASPLACSYPSNVDDKIEKQFDYKLCYYTTMLKLSKTYGDGVLKDGNAQRAAAIRCQVLSPMWVSSMRWISESTEKDARVLSWWDYGHWINYFGQRNAVIRNEHSYLDMILRTAYTYIMGSEDDLKKEMHDYGAQYVLFDSDLILAGSGLGGKFGALNYLACNYANLTDVKHPPGVSLCEKKNTWEIVIVDPSSTCKVSNITGKTGHVAYRVVYVPYGDGYRQERQKAYCLSTTKLADGQEIPALYYLNETTPTGDLKLNKGFLAQVDQYTYHIIYTKDPVWIENGKVVDGWSDRKGRFYDSMLYRGFFIGDLDGFEKVYDNGNVKIYKLIE